MKKPLLTFATPRSGSTLFHSIIYHGLKTTQDIKVLYEIFNISFYSLKDTGSGIEASKVVQPQTQDKTNSYLQIMDLLKKYYGKYVFKLMPDQIYHDDVTQWLIDHYEWIFVERKNLFEQALSYSISRSTDLWYQPDGLKIQKMSVTADPKFIKELEGNYFSYLRYKEMIKPQRVLIYEDFIESQDIEKTLRYIGIENSIDAKRSWLPSKQNEGNKLELFSNPEVFIEAYRESRLNKIFPVTF